MTASRASTVGRTAAGSYDHIARTDAASACGCTAGFTLPAAVSTTWARAARSSSKPQVAGSKAARSASQASIEASTSGGSSIAASHSPGVASVTAARSSQPPSTRTRPAQRSPSACAVHAATIAP